MLLGILLSSLMYSQNITITNSYAKTALAKSDSIVKSIVGQSVFDKYVKSYKHLGFVNCKNSNDVLMFNYDDNFDCKPHIFTSWYYLIENSDTLLNFTLEANTDFNFENSHNDYYLKRLLGYAKVLNGQFSISHSKAKQIAIKNGLNKKDLSVNMDYDDNAAYRHGSNFWVAKCQIAKRCTILHIDPVDGKVLYKGEIFSISIE
jgi:hypothetical protein